MQDIYRTAREEHYFCLGPISQEFSPFSSGITYADPNYHVMRPNGDHYVFEYVTSGHGYVYFNDHKVRLGPGAAYILHSAPTTTITPIRTTRGPKSGSTPEECWCSICSRITA